MLKFPLAIELSIDFNSNNLFRYSRAHCIDQLYHHTALFSKRKQPCAFQSRIDCPIFEVVIDNIPDN